MRTGMRVSTLRFLSLVALFYPGIATTSTVVFGVATATDP
jgi:hypothetical protein